MLGLQVASCEFGVITLVTLVTLLTGHTVNGSTVYIGLGSNLGDKVHNCERALQKIVVNETCSLIKRSYWYQTQPWGKEDQDWFVNGVALVHTSLRPRELMDRFKDVEHRLGRKDTSRWGPRIIDIDILFYDDLVLRSPELEIPHPRLHERNFVLVPLMEIAPQLVHPVLKRTVHDLLAHVKDQKRVQMIMNA